MRTKKHSIASDSRHLQVNDVMAAGRLQTSVYRIAATSVLCVWTAFLPQPAFGQESGAGATVAPFAQPPETTALDVTAEESSLPGSQSSDGTDLLAGELTQHWQVFSSDAVAEANRVWTFVRDSPESEVVLVCTGEPKGYLFTKELVTDFELTLEWKYPTDENGNSGVLVYTQNEPRIWPTSIQVQLHQPKAGNIFPSGDATSDNTRDEDSDLARPVNTWNECRIVGRNGRLAVEINGKKAGEISGARPCCGSVALQSEGSEVHFRRIRLKRFQRASSETVTDPDLIPARAEPVAPGPPTSKADVRRRKRDLRHGRYYLTSNAVEESWRLQCMIANRTTLDCESCGCAAEFVDVRSMLCGESAFQVD